MRISDVVKLLGKHSPLCTIPKGCFTVNTSKITLVFAAFTAVICFGNAYEIIFQLPGKNYPFKTAL